MRELIFPVLITPLVLLIAPFSLSEINNINWRSLFFDLTKHRQPICGYHEFGASSFCWTSDVANDLDLEYISNDERLELKEKVREMFYFGYDNYMRHAFPMDELNPIYCSGRGSDKARPDNINVNDALGDYMLTLVDSLDTLAVIGDVDEFKNAVQLVIQNLTFTSSVVQVFESTIRIIGGLLSAHIMITHPDRVKLYGYDLTPENYDGELLSLARDLGVRLLPAFENAPHGIPWPRVNMQTGVPVNCSEETATAGAGTLLLEFGVLSKLTGDPIFELVARRAVRQIFKFRNPKTGLLGTVMNVKTGLFANQMSGVGAGLDSYYEYLLKSHILFSSSMTEEDRELSDMYDTLMSSIRRHLRVGRPRCHRGWGTTPIYVNVDMRSGEMANNWIDSLQAAFPAILVLSGEVNEAICQHAIYASIWRRYGVLPERFNFRLKAPDVKFYPLRPEFAESTYFLYQATKNPYYLAIGKQIVQSLDDHCKAKCGYATVHDVETMELEDRQESFFLSETVKYLYLLFDTEHPLNVMSERIIFSTEGHVIPIGQWLREGVDDTLSRRHISKHSYSRKRSRPRWITPKGDELHGEERISGGNSSINTNHDVGANFVVTEIPQPLGAISSRSCETIDDLRHKIAPLDLRYLQQINAEIGYER